MEKFLRRSGSAEIISETIISVLFGIVVLALGWLRVLDSKELLVALIIWGLITPSPAQWAITIGNFLKATKDGGGEVQKGNGEDIPPTGGNPPNP